MAKKLSILLDLNVVLDVLQNRQPFYTESAKVLDAVVQQKAQGFVAAHSVTTLFYLLTRLRDRKTAVSAIDGLLNVTTVAPVTDAVIRRAFGWGWSDFEDAVQMAAALEANVDYLITRNVRDFQSGILPVVQPAAFLALLS